jgi:hypothetical protein
MKTFTAFTNVFDDGDGRRYPGGIIFETAEAAVEAQRSKQLKGTAIFVAQITWSEAKSISDWTKRR